MLHLVLRVCLLFFSLLTNSYANTLTLAYLEIKSLDGPVGKTYQVMWKQPANTAASDALQVQFSDGATLSKKVAPILLNGSRINHFTLTTKNGLTGHKLTINNLLKNDAEVIVKYDDHGQAGSIRLNVSNPSYIFQQAPSSFQTIESYTLFGIQHILEGYDHLLFVLCLLIIASSLKKLLWAITGFTIAHSLTLVFSALGLVTLPIAPVEAIIALSIVFLAVEIAKHNRASLSYRYPVAVSSSFGLLHGFGFASVLLELGLPQDDKLLALAFFNVGVEIGQLIFITAVLALIGIVKRFYNQSLSFDKRYQKVASYFIGSIASFWLIERIIQF
ncbi:MAG: HupE/UreJ family protein [Oleispira sp.]|nr:HupE/UreJ family protein [Oleispira sp.]